MAEIKTPKTNLKPFTVWAVATYEAGETTASYVFADHPVVKETCCLILLLLNERLGRDSRDVDLAPRSHPLN